MHGPEDDKEHSSHPPGKFNPSYNCKKLLIEKSIPESLVFPTLVGLALRTTNLNDKDFLRVPGHNNSSNECTLLGQISSFLSISHLMTSRLGYKHLLRRAIILAAFPIRLYPRRLLHSCIPQIICNIVVSLELGLCSVSFMVFNFISDEKYSVIEDCPSSSIIIIGGKCRRHGRDGRGSLCRTRWPSVRGWG